MANTRKGIILVRVSIAVKRHHDHGNSHKGNHFTKEEAYSFRGLVHCHHVKEENMTAGSFGRVQTDMVLENSTSCSKDKRK